MTGPLDDLLDPDREAERRKVANPKTFDTGVVTQVSPLLVSCAGSDESMVALLPYAPALNDLVAVGRGRGISVILGKIGTGYPPQSPAPDPVSGSSMFPAIETFSWRDGHTFAYQQDVRQGAQDGSGAWTGAWFYQGTPGASLAGATAVSASVRVARGSGGVPGSQAAHVFLSSTGIWPTANLLSPTTSGTAVDVTLLPGEAKWVAIPAATAQAIVDTDAGLMVSGASPQVFLAGRDSDPESGLLRIDWERA